jgi:DNA transposition AAA+ family ATPase
MKYFVIVLTLMLTACGEPDPNAPKPMLSVKRVHNIDGCEVKWIDNPYGANFYIARCGDTVTNTWQRQSGKTQITEATINVNSEQDLRKRLAEIEARNKALAKLSAEEKKALGLQ